MRNNLVEITTKLAYANTAYQQKPAVSEAFTTYVREKYLPSNMSVLNRYFVSEDNLFDISHQQSGYALEGELSSHEINKILNKIHSIDEDIAQQIMEALKTNKTI